MEKSSPELCAFRKNYVVLLNLRHGINSISVKAFAGGLISKDLRNKCSNESIADAERTRCLLDALEDKMLYVPTTLQDFVDILNDVTCFEYIGKMLLETLDEELQTKERDKYIRRHSHATPADFPGNAEYFMSLEETKKELKSQASLNLESRQYMHAVSTAIPTCRRPMRSSWDQMLNDSHFLKIDPCNSLRPNLELPMR